MAVQAFARAERFLPTEPGRPDKAVPIAKPRAARGGRQTKVRSNSVILESHGPVLPLHPIGVAPFSTAHALSTEPAIKIGYRLTPSRRPIHLCRQKGPYERDGKTDRCPRTSEATKQPQGVAAGGLDRFSANPPSNRVPGSKPKIRSNSSSRIR